jgi:hypothetical protein
VTDHGSEKPEKTKTKKKQTGTALEAEQKSSSLGHHHSMMFERLLLVDCLITSLELHHYSSIYSF